MVRDVLMDDQPGIDPTLAQHRISRPAQVLRNALLGDEAGVPQTHDFFNGADRDEGMLAALATTAEDLGRDYGSDRIEDWRIELPQHVFATDNYLGIPQAGADETLAIRTAMNRGTQSDMISFRDGKVSVCISAPPGQSGFISPMGEKSPHYDDQLDLYGNFECRPQALLRADVEKVARSRVTLTVE